MSGDGLAFRLPGILFPIFGIVAAGYFYARDLGRVAVCAWRGVRYYLPFHVRGLFRSIFQKG